MQCAVSTRIYVRMHVRAYVCVCARARSPARDCITHTCMYICNHIPIQNRACMQVCAAYQLYVCMYVRHACIHVYAYIFIYIYTHKTIIPMYVSVFRWAHASMYSQKKRVGTRIYACCMNLYAYVFVRVYMLIFMYVCMCVYIYIVCMHVCTRA